MTAAETASSRGSFRLQQAIPGQMRLPRAYTLLGLLGTALLPSAGPAQAQDCGDGSARCASRIIFGQSEATDFEFRPFRPLRRSDASSRQAYFGSGEEYSETLDRLQDQLQRMAVRERLAGLELSPAQEAVQEEMSPALLRALALSQRSRQQGEETGEEN
jgi:hypothetical protein